MRNARQSQAPTVEELIEKLKWAHFLTKSLVEAMRSKPCSRYHLDLAEDVRDQIADHLKALPRKAKV